MTYTRTISAWFNAHVVGYCTGIQHDDAYQRSIDGCCLR
jgi:hypothetical protein